MSRKRIGELLLESGIVSQEQLDQGLEQQQRTQRRLGATLVELGFVSEEQVATTLADTLRLPRVDLAQANVEWGAVHLLKAQFCEAHGLFAYAFEPQAGPAGGAGRRQLLVAMSDPLDIPAVEEIEFTIGLKVLVRVASLSGVRGAILRYYHRVHAPESPPAFPPAPPPAPAGGPAGARKGEGVPLITPAPFNRPANIPTGTQSGTRRPPGIPLETQRGIVPKSLATPQNETVVQRRPQTPLGAAEPPKAGGDPSVHEDLDFLFGNLPTPGDPGTRLDTLVRLLIRKGYLTEAEWLEALRSRG